MRNLKPKLVGMAIAAIVTVAILLGPVAMILVVASAGVTQALRRTRGRHQVRRDLPRRRAA